jgi:hypothetical protein
MVLIMYYEFNISKNGQHFFATAERSITDIRKAKEVLDELISAFPESKGYNITCTYWERAGTEINLETFGTGRHFTK